MSLKNVLIENTYTLAAAAYIEQTTGLFSGVTFRNVKSKEDGGAVYQKYGIDNIGDFNDYHLRFYNDNLFENTFSSGNGGSIGIILGGRA